MLITGIPQRASQDEHSPLSVISTVKMEEERSALNPRSKKPVEREETIIIPDESLQY